MDKAKPIFSLIDTHLGWVPDWALALVLLLIGALAGYILHSVLIGLSRRLIGQQQHVLYQLVQRTKYLTRFALIVMGMAMALGIAPLETTLTLHTRVLLVASFIVLVGWAAILTVNFMADRYIGRFKLDAPDNLLARKAVTQVRVLKRAIDVTIIIITAGLALMSFDSVREIGISLFASAGVAGLAIGLAARPVFSNLIAGIQLALTQPVRIDDAVLVEGEFGIVEEFTSTYVVIKIWDWRRMVVPLSYFLERPFQNWTRTSACLIGSVYLYLDYRTPIQPLRAKLDEILKDSRLWDKQVASVQVTDLKDETMEVRVLASAANSGATFDLRCEIREKLMAYIVEDLPDALPRRRQEASNRPLPSQEQAHA